MHHRLAYRVVNVIGGKQLIAGLETKRPKHCIDALGGVGDEAELIGDDAQKWNEGQFLEVQQLLTPPPQQLNRLRLQVGPPLLLLIEHRYGTGPKRTMVEKRHILLEQPML